MRSDLRMMKEEAQRIETSRAPKERSLESLQTSLDSMQTTAASLKQELGTSPSPYTIVMTWTCEYWLLFHQARTCCRNWLSTTSTWSIVWMKKSPSWRHTAKALLRRELKWAACFPGWTHITLVKRQHICALGCSWKRRRTGWSTSSTAISCDVATALTLSCRKWSRKIAARSSRSARQSWTRSTSA